MKMRGCRHEAWITDKAWAGLQHLLAKAGIPVDIVGGGEPLSDDMWGYDPPRLLNAADVAEASRFLTAHRSYHSPGTTILPS